MQQHHQEQSLADDMKVPDSIVAHSISATAYLFFSFHSKHIIKLLVRNINNYQERFIPKIKDNDTKLLPAIYATVNFSSIGELKAKNYTSFQI